MDCKNGSLLILDQIKSVLTTIDEKQYGEGLDLFSGSTIGKHIRHIFDFYNSIAHIKDGHLDYALRDRDPQIEVNPVYSINAFEALKSKIMDMDVKAMIHVMTDFDLNSDDCQDCVGSTIGRELMYAYDHAVHHLAIVKMGIKSHFPEVQLNNNIGVASSTLKYQEMHQHG